ncbi:MAG: SMC-Scp complex subunit ScpB, partial [Ignavibacteriales bacterium]|nr:SMC-Scp complex subunit ScpB [Ignavibacteriales bacterium]
MAETEITTVPETNSAPNAITERTVLQVPSTIKGLVEALIFAAKEPLSIKQIQALYDEQGLNGESRKIETSEITQIVEELNREFEANNKAYRIVQIAGGYQFATLTNYAEWLGKLYKEQARRKLSQSSVESLAIIAYKQPISKPEIEAIRGVNCDYVLKTLLEKELVTIVGRATTPGRPLLYGTTKEFLKHFGLNEVTDLPRPREIEEILGESQFDAERRMLEAQQGLEGEKKKEEEDFKSRLPHIPKRKPGIDENVQILPKRKQREIKFRSDEGAQQSQETLPLEAQTTIEDPKPAERIEVRSEENIVTQDSSIEAAPTEEVNAETTQELSSPPIEVARVIETLSVEEKNDDVVKVEEEIQQEEITEQNVLEVPPPVIEPVIENIVEETAAKDSQQVIEEAVDPSDVIIEAPQSDEVMPVVDVVTPVSVEAEVI